MEINCEISKLLNTDLKLETLIIWVCVKIWIWSLLNVETVKNCQFWGGHPKQQIEGMPANQDFSLK